MKPQRPDKQAREVPRGATVLDSNEGRNIFVQFPDGEQRNFPWTEANVLKFEHGLWDLIDGSDTIYTFQDHDVRIAATEIEGVYQIWLEGRDPVRNPPKMEEEVLQAVRKLKEEDDVEPLREIYGSIIDTQCRRNVVNMLLDYPPFEDFTEGVDEGWRLFDQFVLTWEGELYNDREKLTTYERSGSSVNKLEGQNQALDITLPEEPERQTVEFDGEKFTFGQKEMEFVSKALYVFTNVEVTQS